MKDGNDYVVYRGMKDGNDYVVGEDTVVRERYDWPRVAFQDKNWCWDILRDRTRHQFLLDVVAQDRYMFAGKNQVWDKSSCVLPALHIHSNKVDNRRNKADFFWN
jgi:hypothetical protein